MGVVAVAPVVPLAGGGGGGSGAPPRQGRGRWYCRATPPRGPPATAVDAAGGPLRRHDRRRRCRWPQWARTERERRDKRRRRRHAQRGHPTGGGHGASCRHRDGDEGCRGRKTNTPGCGGRWWPRRRSGQDAGAAATAAVPATRSRVGADVGQEDMTGCTPFGGLGSARGGVAAAALGLALVPVVGVVMYVALRTARPPCGTSSCGEGGDGR